MKEFNLSEGITFLEGIEVLDVPRVREFISRLKDICWEMAYHNIIDIIDELAGSELTQSPQTKPIKLVETDSVGRPIFDGMKKDKPADTQTQEGIIQGCGAWSQGEKKGVTFKTQCGNAGFKDEIWLCEICRKKLKTSDEKACANIPPDISLYLDQSRLKKKKGEKEKACANCEHDWVDTKQQICWKCGNSK